MGPAEQDVVLVTTAAPSPVEDRHARERRYLITMAVRVLAFVVAIVFATGWIRVIAVVLALVLPWVAVVSANAGPKRRSAESPSLYGGPAQRELTDRKAS